MRSSASPARVLAVVPIVVLLAALLAGCSSRTQELARVGDHAITRDDFFDVARRNQGQYPGPPDSARSALLGDLVRRELLVIAAEKQNLVPAADQARLRRQAEDQLGVRALIQAMAPSDVAVSDAEVEALYRQRDREAHVLIVFTPDQAAIEQALAQIRRGADFGQVADRFNTTGMTPPQGDLKFVTPGTLLPVLDQAVVSDSIGRIAGPLESPGEGWFLVKITERRPRKQEPFDQVRETLKQALQRGKQRVLLNRAQRELTAQYHLRIEPGAVPTLFRRYNAPKDTVPVGAARLPVPAPPTRAEAAEVLMRWDGADGKPVTYTLGEAVSDLRNGNGPRPNVAIAPMIEQWLRSTGLQRVAELEARRRHLAEEPGTARQVRETVNNALLQAAYNTLVVEPTSLSEEDVRADFQRQASHLTRLASAQVRLATLGDSAASLRAATALQGGGDFDAALRAAGPGAHVAATEIRFPSSDPLWSRLEGVLRGMKPGEARGPFRMARGWAMVQLVSRADAAADFAKLDPGMRQALQSDALEFKREQRLTQVTDSLRRRYPVTLHRDRLARIPWPVPPAKAGA